jgi:acetylornithine deacetylase/succinyl-diaminopimelate desuccinylase-like protein
MTSATSRATEELVDLRLEELDAFLRIPSISADPAFATDVRAACEWVGSAIEALGGTSMVTATDTHPLVLGRVPASRRFADRAPTVLLYGHADVQAAGDEDAWESPPFEPTVRDGWLYARGAADDKGNFFMLLRALEALVANDDLPVNVRILCDAEEEILGRSAVEFLEGDSEPLDACLIYDAPMPRHAQPAFYVATRGLVYFHLRLSVGKHELHSGLFGGAALNATHALARLITGILDNASDLHVGTSEPSSEEVASWGFLDPGDAVLRREGTAPADALAAADFYRRTLATLAIEVAGVASGEPFIQKNVMPATAAANIQIRLAPGQDSEQVSALFEDLLDAVTPAGATVEVERWATAPAALVQTDSAAFTFAREAFSRALGVSPILIRSGGTLPVLGALAARGIPTILTGFDLPEGNVHAANERLLLEHIPLGIRAARETLRAFGSLSRSSNPE